MMEKLLLFSEASCSSKFQDQFLQVSVRRRAAKKKKLNLHQSFNTQKRIKLLSVVSFSRSDCFYFCTKYIDRSTKESEDKTNACAQTYTVHDSHLTQISGQDRFQLC